MLVTTGCARSCKEEHPYVPYAVGDALPAATAEADAEGEPSAANDDARAPEPALVAPPSAKLWNLDGRELKAPEGTEFALALSSDMDADGKSDVLALVRAAAGDAQGPADIGPSALVYYAGTSDAGSSPTVVVAPKPVGDATCSPILRLARLGTQQAFAELGAACPHGDGGRALHVVRLGKVPRVTFDMFVTDPEGAPKLEVDVDGRDLDADGVDDVTLLIAIEGSRAPFEAGPRLTAKVPFFDRPAGKSRAPDEPEASLRSIAAQAKARSGKAKEAASVPALVRQLRELYRAICTEGSAPRLVRGSERGGAVSCGASKALVDADIAEVRAYITQRDPLRALLSAERVARPPQTKTKAQAKELTALIDGLSAPAAVKTSRWLDVPVALARGPHPTWGPLAFEPSGRLLVRGDTKVVRLDPTTDERGDAEMAPWPLQVLSPDGQSRWLEAYHTCGGGIVRATFAPTGGDGDVRELLLPAALPLGGRCADRRGEPSAAFPIAWGAEGLEAIVDGEPLWIRPAASSAVPLSAPRDAVPVTLGAPRSPSGKLVVLPTSDAIVVLSTTVARYRDAALEPYAQLHGCAISDDGAHVACEKRGRVVLLSL